TLAALWVTVAICAAEGLDGRAATELLSALTDDVMALVWLGKSFLAELTSVAASLWILLTCDSRLLTPLLALRLVSPLTEFCGLFGPARWPGLLLLLQPANATPPLAATKVKSHRAQVPPGRACVLISASNLALPWEGQQNFPPGGSCRVSRRDSPP